MSKKISEHTQNNEIKNTKSFCKHNQNRSKTNFLINLNKIGMILGLLQVLLSLVFTLFVMYLSGYIDNLSPGSFWHEDTAIIITWTFFLVMVFFIIIIACKIKLIKNHESSKLNCQKIEQNIQQAIKSFKENIEITIYFWLWCIGLLIFVDLLMVFSNFSSKPIIFQLLSSIIMFCYFFIGLSCILFIRKPKK